LRRLVDAIAPVRMGERFRWFLGSAFVSNLGDGIGLAAAPLLVASLTDRAILVALASVLQILPWFLFGLHAGVLADRFDRRTIVVAVNLVRAAVLGVLSVTILTDTVGVTVVLVTMFALGTAETFADTTSSTLLPMLVSVDDLTIGNARLTFMNTTVNRMAGPPVGAFLFAAGAAVPFVAQGVCVASGAVLIRRIGSARARRPDQGQTVRAEIAEGIRWVWHHAAIRTLLITVLCFNVTFGATWGIMVLYATEHLGLGKLGFGLITTVGAVGGAVGAAIYASVERRIGMAWIMRGGLVIETLTHLLLASTASAAVALPVYFVFGIHEAGWATTASTIRQRVVPEHLQGRVGAVTMVGLFGSLVAGAAVGGVIAEVWGITAPFWFGFAGSAVILVMIWHSLGAIALAPPASAGPAPAGT
jgi:MFS family permease